MAERAAARLAFARHRKSVSNSASSPSRVGTFKTEVAGKDAELELADGIGCSPDVSKLPVRAVVSWMGPISAFMS
jgi:hypothetical protein